jgi:hypothetical protein
MCIYEADFGGCDSCVLEFHGGALFAAEYDDVGAFDADGAGASFDGFKRIFDLENVSVRAEFKSQ